MFKNFEVKFSTDWHCILFGYSREISGMESTLHSVYIGPWCLTLILH